MIATINNKKMLTDTAYKVGKRLVQVVLPGIGGLYFGLAKIWGFPQPENVVGTITLLTTFLGLTLHISSSQYDNSGAALIALQNAQDNPQHDGEMNIISHPDGSKTFSLETDKDVDDFENMSHMVFKINKEKVEAPKETVPAPVPPKTGRGSIHHRHPHEETKD